MRKLLLPLPLLLLVNLGGCAGDYPVRRVERPVNVTHEVAFGDYRRVYNTAYHILNRYGVVQNASYRYGEITALVSEDTSLFDKTRKTIQARIFDAGNHWEVECRVLLAVEDSEVSTLSDFVPRYHWTTVSSDSQLEVRLNNEIRAALSGGAWQAKEALTPKAREPVQKAPRKTRSKATRRAKKKGVAAEDDTDEVSDFTSPKLSLKGLKASSAAFERLGLLRMRRGSFKGAVKAFQAAIRNSKDARFVHFLLAQARFSQGKFVVALASMRQGAQLNPDWHNANLDVRSFYAPGLKTFPQRLGQLERAAASKGDLNLLLGYMRYFSKDAEGSLKAFDAYATSNPTDAVAVSYRGAARKLVDAAHGLEDF